MGMKKRVDQFMWVTAKKMGQTARETSTHTHTHTNRGERRSVCEGIGSPAEDHNARRPSQSIKGRARVSECHREADQATHPVYAQALSEQAVTCTHTHTPTVKKEEQARELSSSSKRQRKTMRQGHR